MSGPPSWSALADEVSAAGARFGAPLGAGERLALERRLGVELPTDYRWVLEQVGAGSSDGPPYYGLASPKEPRDIDERPAHPERPFPLTKPWVWEDDPEIDEARLDAVWQHGWLWLGTDGCGMDWALVVSGSARGQVWSLTDVGAAPYGEGAGFATWLGDWLAGGPIWRFGSDTVDWLRAFTRPVAKVEAGGRRGRRSPGGSRVAARAARRRTRTARVRLSRRGGRPRRHRGGHAHGGLDDTGGPARHGTRDAPPRRPASLGARAARCAGCARIPDPVQTVATTVIRAHESRAAASEGSRAFAPKARAAERLADQLETAQAQTRQAIGEAKDAEQRIAKAKQAIAEAKGRHQQALGRVAAAELVIAATDLIAPVPHAAHAERDQAQRDADQAQDDEQKAHKALESAQHDLKDAQRKGHQAQQHAQDATTTANNTFNDLATQVPQLAPPRQPRERHLRQRHKPLRRRPPTR
jgi:hypothetical protein